MSLAHKLSTSSLGSASSLHETASTAATSRPPSPTPSTSSSTSRRLPVRLPRSSTSQPVDGDAVCAAAGLAGVPADYARQRLAALGPALLRATADARVVVMSANAARVTIAADTAVEHRPTYVLALSDDEGEPMHLPVHGLVYALACAALPQLAAPSSDLPPACPSSGSFAVPIVRLAVPSVATMPVLGSYLVTRRTDALLHDLLPDCTSAADAGRESIPAREAAARIAKSVAADALRERLARVHRLWSNVVALGGMVEDAALWSALDAAWAVLLAAMALQQQQPIPLCV